MVNSLGRSSDLWIVLLPVPSHPSKRTVASTGFVTTYSGGTARDSHPLPFPRNYNVTGTLGERGNFCQVH